MTKRIFKYICLVALAVFLACMLLIMGVLYEYFTGEAKAQLRAQTDLAAQGVARNGIGFFDGLDTTDYRITLVGADGNVIYDSAADAEEMKNHADREEIAAARETGSGESSRYSETLTRRSFYCAKLLPDGSVLRLSCTQSSVIALMLGMLQPILVIALIAALLSLFFASKLSKRIVQPLNELNLDEPLKNDCYDELTPLLRRIESQHRQILLQLELLRQKQDEFEAVTGSMNEGLLLLNDKGTVLSINAAAARILDADRGCVGQDALTLNRSVAMQELLEKVLGGEQAQAQLELSSGIYELDASPVMSDGRLRGAALLLFDVTDKADAEQMRREFTANVSHELKTPLHSISGCAELLLNGMVKPEDVKQFDLQIYSEAQRMIRLVDDILRLSRLDEGAIDMQRNCCDLFELSRSTLDALQSEAQAAGISLSLEGGSAVINGIPQLLDSIIFNLCDNAIKYNKPGGSVCIRVEDFPDHAVLTVSDTGIGIPAEHQTRVFERFYRVDKSHSKEIGGTGLGLSIVKHAARLHKAKIELESTPGHGSSFRISFSK